MDAARLDEFRELVLTKIAFGLSPENACILAGVPLSDISEVLDSDEMAELIAYQEAKLEEELLEIQHMAMLKAARNGTANPAQWRLEKHFPSRYGARLAVSTNPTMRKPLSEAPDLTALSDDELKRLARGF